MTPSWPGASAAYSRAYRILERLARKGLAKPARGHHTRSGKWVQTSPGSVDPEMASAIEALNEGDEEKIKAFNLRHLEVYCEHN